MTITTNPVRNQYNAANGQDVFNYTFKIYDSQDLTVYLTPAGQEADDATDLITAYTVDPGTIGNQNGGFITLDVGANAGDVLTIVSSIPYDRETDYQTNGDFAPETINGDIDRVVSLVKQNKALINRALLSPESGEGGSDPVVIPSPDNGKGLIWKDDNLANTTIVESVTTDTTQQSLISINGNDVKVRGLKGSQNVSFVDDGENVTIIAEVQGGAGDVGSQTNNEFIGDNSFTGKIGVWNYEINTTPEVIGYQQPDGNGDIIVAPFPNLEGGYWVELQYEAEYSNIASQVGGDVPMVNIGALVGSNVSDAEELRGDASVELTFYNETSAQVTARFFEQNSNNLVNTSGAISVDYDTGTLINFAGLKAVYKGKILAYVKNLTLATSINYRFRGGFGGQVNTATRNSYKLKYRILPEQNITEV